jgi:hypothetical protein
MGKSSLKVTNLTPKLSLGLHDLQPHTLGRLLRTLWPTFPSQVRAFDFSETSIITDMFLHPDSRAARNYASLCCEEFGLTDMDKDDVLSTSQVSALSQPPSCLVY